MAFLGSMHRVGLFAALMAGAGAAGCEGLARELSEGERAQALAGYLRPVHARPSSEQGDDHQTASVSSVQEGVTSTISVETGVAGSEPEAIAVQEVQEAPNPSEQASPEHTSLPQSDSMESPSEATSETTEETKAARPTYALPEVAEWMPDAPRCHRRPRRHCDGPRWFPVPSPADAVRAERFALGDREGYNRVLSGPADEALLAEANAAGETEPTLLWPVPEGTLGRGFGFTREGALRSRRHRGVDMPAAVGAVVRSTGNGLVVYADNGIRGYGNLIVILHGDDSRTFYAHLERGFVTAGQLVARGQVIGQVGRTGLTHAPHLHFEWRRRAVPHDPTRRFEGRPRGEEEARLLRDGLARRRKAEARLAQMRARAERRARREAARRDDAQPIEN